MGTSRKTSSGRSTWRGNDNGSVENKIHRIRTGPPNWPSGKGGVAARKSGGVEGRGSSMSDKSENGGRG